MRPISNLVPGPGTYDIPPTFGGTGRAAVILPLSPRELWQLHAQKEDDDALARHPSSPSAAATSGAAEGSGTKKESSIPRYAAPIVPQWHVPPPGTYDLPSTIESPRMQIHGTPRSERVLFNVDLTDRSRMPGPGQYNVSNYKSMVGRDRTYRTRLDIERVNVMAPLATSPKQRKVSPRR